MAIPIFPRRRSLRPTIKGFRVPPGVGVPPGVSHSSGGDIKFSITKKAVQTLKLANGSFNSLKDGSKKCTVRAGKREISLGPLIFESADPVKDGDADASLGEVYIFQEVNVTEVRHTTLRYLSDEVAQMDGVNDAVELLRSLRNFYPDLDLDDEITIIIFDEVKDYGKT